MLGSAAYRDLANKIGETCLGATMASLDHDTHVGWRPRVPQWRAIGEIMVAAVRASLIGQATPKEALDQAQRKITHVRKG